MPCAPSSTTCPSDGTRGDRRGRARRGADALYRRGGRHQERTRGRHRARSARRHDHLRQEPAELARRHRASPSEGSLLYAPDVYMDKIAIGPGYPEGLVDLDAAAGGKHCPHRRAPRACRSPRSPPASSTGRAMPRLIEEVRATGAAIRLIGDGDVAGVIHTTDPAEDRHRHLYRHRRRAGGRAGGRGAALHRRPDAGPAGARHTGEDRARPPHGHRRTRPRLRHGGDGLGRRALRRHRRHRRQPAAGRALRPRHHHHAHHRHALVLRHGARDQGDHQDMDKFA